MPNPRSRKSMKFQCRKDESGRQKTKVPTKDESVDDQWIRVRRRRARSPATGWAVGVDFALAECRMPSADAGVTAQVPRCVRHG